MEQSTWMNFNQFLRLRFSPHCCTTVSISLLSELCLLLLLTLHHGLPDWCWSQYAYNVIRRGKRHIILNGLYYLFATILVAARTFCCCSHRRDIMYICYLVIVAHYPILYIIILGRIIYMYAIWYTLTTI